MRSVLRYRQARRFSTVSMILVLNLICYAAWVVTSGDSANFMPLHFLVSWDALIQGRYWTLLTSAFSHNLFWHFFINMYVLNSFGRIVEMVLSRHEFVIFYILASLTSSMGHALVSRFILDTPGLPALGASGAVAGLVILFSLVFPKEKIAIFGVIPMPAIVGAVAFIALDIWGLFAQAEGGGLPIGHGAHLGGAAVGIFYYFFYLRPQLKNDLRTVNIF